jgi:hypothetical protein
MSRGAETAESRQGEPGLAAVARGQRLRVSPTQSRPATKSLLRLTKNLVAADFFRWPFDCSNERRGCCVHDCGIGIARRQPVPDSLDDFGLERHASRPVPPRPVPRAYNLPRPHSAMPARAPLRRSSTRYSSFWSFATGSLFGVLLCVVTAYVVTRPQLPISIPAPHANVVAERAMAPAPAPPGADERRDPPVLEPAAVEPIPTPSLPPKTGPAPSPPVIQAAARPVAAQPQAPPATAGFVGTLQIDSTPQGAQVFIDRRPVGATPLRMTDVSAGSHVIRLEAERHVPWASAIRVVANQQTDIRTILAPSREDGQHP